MGTAFKEFFDSVKEVRLSPSPFLNWMIKIIVIILSIPLVVAGAMVAVALKAVLALLGSFVLFGTFKFSFSLFGVAILTGDTFSLAVLSGAIAIYFLNKLRKG